ncbi:MAG: two-component regulator propeller domain-containing protein [Adhaeribacter sp.]
MVIRVALTLLLVLLLWLNGAFLPDLDVYALVKDKNGFIWAGTDKGIAVFDESENFFQLPPLRLLFLI